MVMVKCRKGAERRMSGYICTCFATCGVGRLIFVRYKGSTKKQKQQHKRLSVSTNLVKLICDFSQNVRGVD